MNKEEKSLVESIKGLSPIEKERLKNLFQSLSNEHLPEKTTLQKIMDNEEEKKYLNMLSKDAPIETKKCFQGLEEAHELYKQKKLSPMEFFNLFKNNDRKHWSIWFKKDSRFIGASIWAMFMFFVIIEFVFGGVYLLVGLYEPSLSGILFMILNIVLGALFILGGEFFEFFQEATTHILKRKNIKSIFFLLKPKTNLYSKINTFFSKKDNDIWGEYIYNSDAPILNSEKSQEQLIEMWNHPVTKAILLQKIKNKQKITQDEYLFMVGLL